MTAIKKISILSDKLYHAESEEKPKIRRKIKKFLKGLTKKQVKKLMPKLIDYGYIANIGILIKLKKINLFKKKYYNTLKNQFQYGSESAVKVLVRDKGFDKFYKANKEFFNVNIVCINAGFSMIVEYRPYVFDKKKCLEKLRPYASSDNNIPTQIALIEAL